MFFLRKTFHHLSESSASFCCFRNTFYQNHNKLNLFLWIILTFDTDPNVDHMNLHWFRTRGPDSTGAADFCWSRIDWLCVTCYFSTQTWSWPSTRWSQSFTNLQTTLRPWTQPSSRPWSPNSCRQSPRYRPSSNPSSPHADHPRGQRSHLTLTVSHTHKHCTKG